MVQKKHVWFVDHREFAALKDAESISKIINLFRTAKTATVDIGATLYACRIEFCNSQGGALFQDVLQLFYD